MTAASRPGLVLAVAALATIVAALGVVRLEPQVDFVDTVPDHGGLDAYRELLTRLDGVRFVAIYMADATGTGLRTPATFDALVAEQADLSQFLTARFPNTFSHQLSAYEAMQAGNYMLEKLATAGNARPESYAMPEDPVRHQLVRDQVLGGDSIDDVLAQDGSSALMLWFFATPDNLEARRLSGDVAGALADWQGAHVTSEHAASGLLYSSDYTDTRNRDDLTRWGLAAAGAVAVALLWVVRRPSNVVLAVAGMGVATVWTFGLMGWLGVRISFLTLFLAPVVMGIGIDAATHLLHRVEEEGGDRKAVATALHTTGRTITAATATTAAGLAVLALVPNPLFAQIGWVAAVGIALSLLAAFTVVAPARALLGSGRRRPLRPARQRNLRPAHQPPLPHAHRLAKAAAHVRRNPGATIAVVALLTAGAGWLASHNHVVSGSAENEFPQDDPVIVLQHRIEAEYGAFQRAYIIVRGDMTDPTALRTLRDGATQAQDLPLYRSAASVVDLLLADAATDQGALDVARGTILEPLPAAQGDDDLPNSQAEARQRLDQLFADPLWRTIAPFTITRDYDLAVLAVTVEPWDSQSELVALRDALDALAAAMQADLPGHDVDAGGAPSNRAAVLAQTPINIALATIGVAIAVGGVLAVWWRRRGAEGLQMAGVAVGLVLLATVWLLAAIPALDWLYGATGTANNVALNDMFLLAFAITVAAGVDDFVHIVGRFWESRDAGADVEQAVAESWRHAGRAITGTTVTSFVAFAVLGGVYFLQSKNLAILTAFGVAVAYLLTLAVAPLVLTGTSARRSLRP